MLYDYKEWAECGQEFEGLMPKAIEGLGGCGEGEANLSVFAQGMGATPLEVIDIKGLSEK